MKTHKRFIVMMALIAILAIGMAFPDMGHALGTTAGTAVTNQSSVTYEVNGAAQPTLYSCSTAACTQTTGGQPADLTSFTVDKKVNFTVTTVGGNALSVTPGQTDTGFGYLITNTGNTAARFDLSRVISDTNNILTDEGSVRIYLDVNGNGVKDAGENTSYVDPTTFGDIASDATLTVVVVQNVSGTAANGLSAFIDSFTVVAVNPIGGAAFVEGGVAGSGNAIVFADAGYDNTETVATDRVWTVGAPVLTVQKTQTLISDGAGGTTGYIPGAIVEYTITALYSSGTGSATSVILSDDLPPTLAPLADQYSGGTAEVARTIYDVATTTTTTTYLADPNADIPGWNTAAGSIVTVNCGGTLDEAGDYCEIKFRVTVQ